MPQDGQEVLGIGCGTGKPVAGYLIAKGCRITGADGAAAPIDLARESFRDHVWITADMRDLPPWGRFHGLVAWHSFFHLTPADQRRCSRSSVVSAFPAPLCFSPVACKKNFE
ncbi:class I SAM-dependent methyltransferase [Pseudochelatococcus sp. B33]